MYIDINSSVGHWPFQQLRYNTCSALLERMNKFGVDVAVISNLNGVFYKNTQSANEELHKEIRSERRFRDRFIPFAVINPTYAGWKDDLKVSVETLGMKGVRIFPKYHDFPIDDLRCVELVKKTRDYGLPVAFTFRMVDSRQRSWLDIDFVADTQKSEWDITNILPIIRAVPDAKYMLLNLANDTSLAREDLELIKTSRILFDTSGRAITNMAEFGREYGFDKFAFGSHSPILDYVTSLLRIESLTDAEADDEIKRLLRSDNALKMLQT